MVRETEPIEEAGLTRYLLWVLLGGVVLAVVVTAVLAPHWGRVASGPAVPKFGLVPEFTLVNRDGRFVARSDLEGRPWVASFIFTRCALSCPRITARMVELGESLPTSLAAARVSFTVDPLFDTPEVLQEYAESWGASAPDWYFLTGDEAVIRSVVREGFHLAVEPGGPETLLGDGEAILHSSRLVLVDSRSEIRGYYDAFDESELERLVGDLERVSEGEAG